MSGTIGSTVLDLDTASALTGAEAVYVVQNGQDRQTTSGAIGQLARSSVPSASLLGGSNGTLVGVAVGSGLSLSVSGTLTADGILAATSTAPGVAVALNSGTIALTPGTIAGASFIGVLGTASAAASVSPIASLPFLSNASIEPGGTFNTVTVSTAGQITAGSNAAYLLNNQTVTLSGDITGAGTTSIVATLPSILAAGTFNLGTFNAKGQITAGQSIAYLTTLAAGLGIGVNGNTIAARATITVNATAGVNTINPTASLTSVFINGPSGGGACTLAFGGATGSDQHIITNISQGATPATWNFPTAGAGMNFSSSLPAPTITPTAGKRDVLQWINNVGTVFDFSAILQGFSP